MHQKTLQISKLLDEISSDLSEHVKQRTLPDNLEEIQLDYEVIRQSYFNLLKQVFILVGRKSRNNSNIESV
jgi:Tfp pilus assembly PilM family ATPase